MELKQLEYIVKIAEERNITKAAEKMYITQSALNQQLLKLEKELGSQLFYRSRTNWKLTEIGEIYIKNAEKILNIKKETYDHINDLLEKDKSNLRIGLTPERGISMFASVYPKFYKLFPNVSIEPIEMNVKIQEKMIGNGQLDIGFVTLSKEQRIGNNTYVPILEENILMAVPSIHPLAKSVKGEKIQRTDLKLFKNDTFVLLSRNTTMREIIDPLFKKAGFVPNILFETKSSRTLYQMVSNHLACTFISEIYAKENEKIVYFSLPESPSWELCTVYRKGAYLSKAAKSFIKLAEDYWKNNIK
ncbi:LysR family transcriptional regulator [Fusobacterium sp.]|uniref:LysR family transcriptional regulator n=1 Tax=Fusobacterium sp. TaxID=68766 RepID=UPI002903722D|nr:LysR family transcriptional regulator [Fusobacterium sp.]MDU1911971.1 LysR family transcriptional regulator [Fusobacterium sp.]